MGRGKVQMKRIEDKTSRQVSFSKRRCGLQKKALELSVLCDVEVALIIFSGKGKLYDFCSNNNSLEMTLERYKKYSDAEKKVTAGVQEMQEHGTPQTNSELLEITKQYFIEQDIDQLNLSDLAALEQQLDRSLRQTRARKNKLTMDSITELREKVAAMKKEVNKKKKKKDGGSTDGGILSLGLAYDLGSLPLQAL